MALEPIRSVYLRVKWVAKGIKRRGKVREKERKRKKKKKERREEREKLNKKV
jgi:hypothetical protein